MTDNPRRKPLTARVRRGLRRLLDLADDKRMAHPSISRFTPAQLGELEAARLWIHNRCPGESREDQR